MELRRPTPAGAEPFFSARAGEALNLPKGGKACLLTPYRPEQRSGQSTPSGARPPERVRLWIAALQTPLPVPDYLARCGSPIRYEYVRDAWPLAYYQTVFATEMGSAEMPSAGRAFTPELVERLQQGGVEIAPLALHTGVASLEDHEPPYEEFYRVPAATARAINQARQAGGRILAVGTTVVRALETVVKPDGETLPGEGWTDKIVGLKEAPNPVEGRRPASGLRSVDGLLTGLHEPRSTHLAMLAALAGPEHVRATYAAALQEGYLWHEFGDLHLILPG